MVNPRVAKCLLECVDEEIDPAKKLILNEANRLIIGEQLLGHEVIDLLIERTGKSKRFITDTLCEAAKLKDNKMKIIRIAEGIDDKQ